MNVLDFLLVNSTAYSALKFYNLFLPAIIGGGIGGTSTAHFLIDLFGRKNIDIDIYEANKIGGRLATAKVGDFEYETGGSVIHTSNKYMEDLISTLGKISLYFIHCFQCLISCKGRLKNKKSLLVFFFFFGEKSAGVIF